MLYMNAVKAIFQNPSLDFETMLEMYVIKDGSSYIFSIPSESFSVKMEKNRDFEDFVKFGTIFGHSDFRSELVNEMKKMVSNIE